MAGPSHMAKVPVGRVGPVVQAEHLLGREALEQPVVDHHPPAAAALLGRLEDQVDGAGEVAGLGEIARRTQQHGGVAVMAAGVHPAGTPRRPGERRLASWIGRASMSARRPMPRPPRPPLITATTPVRPMPVCTSSQPKLSQLLGHERRRLVLLEAELRPLVQVAPPRGQLVLILGDAVDDRHGGAPRPARRRP